jgi:rod shape-determining protein MreD
MAWLRALLAVVLVLTALVIELTALPLLRLPGATPDILAVTVIALGFVGGPVRGAGVGFLAGLLLDLSPPSAGVLGLTAVVFVIAGYVAGTLGAERERGAFATVGITGLLAAATTLGIALVGGLVGDPRISWDRVPGLLVTQLVYSLVVAAFVVPLVTVLWRRVDPPTSRYEMGRQ